MILSSDDLTEWVSTRKDQLVVAWTPQIEKASGWEPPFAEALADELHTAMITTLTRGGTETQFLKLIARSNTSLKPKDEQAVAQRFYGVTLKLARASGRKRQYDQGSFVAPLKRAVVVGDTRTNHGHLALSGIVLPLGHPFWERWEPPLDMDCRCITIQVTRSQFERDGLAITSPDELARRETELSASWPREFEPLLDFRAPSPVVEWPGARDGDRKTVLGDGDVFDAVLRASSLNGIGDQLKKLGF